MTALARLFVCTNCPHLAEGEVRIGDSVGTELLGLLETAVQQHGALTGKASVERVKCMGGCKTPCSVAMAAPGKETLLFGHMTPGDVRAIVGCFEQYVASPAGHRMSKAERPEALKDTLMVRVPAAPL